MSRTIGRPRPARLATALTLVLFSAGGPSATALWALSSGDAEPAHPDARDTQPATIDDTVTVTATLNARDLFETPFSVDVLTAEDVERQASDPVDLVRYLPGVTVDQETSRLGSNGFTIRGIGGNRVLTLVDGVPNAEQFDFGPLAIHQYGLDLASLASVEVVRSAGSALYGSDALGGVVSLVTRGPDDYLALVDGSPYYGGALRYDGRADESHLNAAGAMRRDGFAASLYLSGWTGGARANQGTVDRADTTRTRPNPQDRFGSQLLGKLVWSRSPQRSSELTIEGYRTATDTDVFSARTVQELGPMFGPGVTYTIATDDFRAEDSQQRLRLSFSQGRQSTRADGWFDRLDWRLFAVRDQTEQDTTEHRLTTIGGGFFGPLHSTPSELAGLYTFDQDTLGAEVVLTHGLQRHHGDHLVTWGLDTTVQRFDMYRDRQEVDPSGRSNSESGYPTKYFPRSDLTEVGLFVQDEIRLANGRWTLVPGLRYDLYQLDPTVDDRVYLEGNAGILDPVSMDNDAFSPRLGVTFALDPSWVLFAQYARGFRAPPFSEVNNGFTNVAFGYTTLPNGDLAPETSDNFEVGLRHRGQRWTGSLVYFDDRYDDFIDTATLGVNPTTGLLEFQPQNLDSVAIHGAELSLTAALRPWLEARGAFSWSEGEVETTGVPLNSVAPHQAVVGFHFQPKQRSWSGELIATFTGDKDESAVDRSSVDQFAPASSTVIDLTGTYDLSPRLQLRMGLYNALDETYWNWGAVRGVAADSSVLDRYSSPGRSVVVSARFHR